MWVKQIELLLAQENTPKFFVEDGVQSKKQKLLKEKKRKEGAKTKILFFSIVVFSSYNSLMHHKCSEHSY